MINGSSPLLRRAPALDEVYFARVLRGGEFYLLKKLGAFGTNLSLLANFFENPWTQPVAALSSADQSWAIGQAGIVLRAVGRLSDAVEPMRPAAAAEVRMEHWDNAAISYNNLSELLLALGNVSEAVAAARQSVDFADRSGDEFQKTARRATLADAFHQIGDLAAAKPLFEEAQRLEAEHWPQHRSLFSLRGYQYCDLLLSEGKTAEVLRRATETLAWAEKHGALLDIGLDHLSLGRAYPRGSPGSTNHLDEAVEFLRRSGRLDDLPPALLARGTDRDLEEVFRIATRSGMRLLLADYHLAKGNLAEAERLINETGYHRRDPELAELKARKA